MEEMRKRYADTRHSGYWALKALSAGEVVEVEGIPVRMIDGDLTPGDTYVGARNTVNLLTVRSVGYLGCVWPQEPAYPFDLDECIKVEPVW